MFQYIKEALGYHMLPYIDDFLLAPSSPMRSFTNGDCADAREGLDWLIWELGLMWHLEKKEWVGSR